MSFEGEYLNGKRTGKGKEYNGYANYMSFEGEYFNGERTGKGKEYHSKDVLEFEGEYLNGKRHGKGKEYDYDGNLIFEGEYLYGHERKGKKYIKGILEFEGEYLFDRKWDGKGYDENGNIIYEIKNGKGTIKEYDFDRRLIYEGGCLNGKRNGKGKEYKINFNKIKDNLVFEGEYLNRKWWTGKGYDANDNISFEIKEGKGYIKEYYNRELKFEGEYINGERNGKGKGYYIEEKEDESCGCYVYEGEYLNGKKNGKGKKYYDFGYSNKICLIYEGEYFNGTANGYGKIYKPFGLVYEGGLLYNQKSGKGKEFNKWGNLIFEGEFFNGLRNGKGKEYDDNGKLIFEGEYFNGLKLEKK